MKSERGKEGEAREMIKHLVSEGWQAKKQAASIGFSIEKMVGQHRGVRLGTESHLFTSTYCCSYMRDTARMTTDPAEVTCKCCARRAVAKEKFEAEKAAGQHPTTSWAGA